MFRPTNVYTDEKTHIFIFQCEQKNNKELSYFKIFNQMYLTIKLHSSILSPKSKQLRLPYRYLLTS